MVEARIEDAAVASAAPPDLLPIGLRRDWPVPRYEVYGKRDGFVPRLEALLVRGLLAGASRLPRPVQDIFIGALARVARRADRVHSDAARTFLRQALGASLGAREVEERVLQAWKHLFRVTLDSEAFDRKVPLASIRDHYAIELSDDVQRVAEGKRGCIIVTGHIGDWEAGSAILPWIGFDPCYVISKPPRNRPLSIHFQRVREKRGIRFLPRRGAMKDAPAVIKAGGSVVMMLDQRARVKPVIVPFFGRPARCDRSAGVLLKRLGAPIVFGACYGTARPFRYHFSMRTVLWPEEFARETPEAIARLVNAELERMILEHPDQFFWLHDRYRGAEG